MNRKIVLLILALSTLPFANVITLFQPGLVLSYVFIFGAWLSIWFVTFWAEILLVYALSPAKTKAISVRPIHCKD